MTVIPFWQQKNRKKMRLRKILKRLLWILIPLAVIWVIGDFGYSCYVASKLRAWESNIVRDEDGVMENCQAYSIGSGETGVLLLHGINDTPYTYRKLAPELSKSFTVRVMRMPGFGEPLDVCATKTSEDWIAALKKEAAQLRDKHERVYVVAHSLGGAVTIQTILREGDAQHELFDGVVLLAPAIEVSNRRSPLLPTRTWHQISGGLVFTRMTYNPFGNDCQDPTETDSPNRVPFTPRSMINETFKLIDANRGRADEFKLPVLVVLSTLDQVNDSQASEQWLKSVGSKEKSVYWNNRSGHALQYDLGWQSVAQEIQKFVEQQSISQLDD